MLEDIFQGAWSPAVSLYEIITQLPLFVKSKKLNDSIGRFDLFRALDFSDWNKRPDMGWFFCQELDNDMRIIEERVCLVSHSYILILQIDPHVVDLGYIIYFSPFNALNSVRIKQGDPNIVAISSKINKGEFLLLRVNKGKEMLELFLRNSNMLKIVNSKGEAEESLIMNSCIYSYIERVEELEKSNKGNNDSIVFKEMLKLYQMIIEYFSAVGDKRYEFYLQKSRDLFMTI